MRFRAVVGRVEWRVVHDVEEARGSWGGRGACDSVFAGSRLTAIVQYLKIPFFTHFFITPQINLILVVFN